MEQTFRKVTFAFIPSWESASDENDQREIDELSRVRNGFFHGTTEIHEDELRTLKFIVEDEETGKVYRVDPLLVTFNK